MAINFPDSPSNGDSFTSNNKTWVFDGTVWNITSGTNSVADGAITTAKIASGAVTAAKLGNDISLTPADGSITAAKIASNAVTTEKVAANAITQAKLAANVSGITITTTANRDTDIPSPFTGQFCFLTDTSTLQRYTGSVWETLASGKPVITNVSPIEVDSSGGGNQTISITGSNFAAGAVTTFLGALGSNFNASTTAVNNVSSITATAPKASFLNAQEPYSVMITNPNGSTGTINSQIYVDNAPTWSTSSGQIGGNIFEGDSVSTSVTATDVDGDAIVYSETTSVLASAGFTLNSSTGEITGIAASVNADTTNTFTLRATANAKTSDRSFNIVVKDEYINKLNILNDNSCVALYPLNSSTVDISGNYSGTGMSSGTATYSTAIKRFGTASFNCGTSTANIITIPNPRNAYPLSVSVWAHRSTWSGFNNNMQMINGDIAGQRLTMGIVSWSNNNVQEFTIMYGGTNHHTFAYPGGTLSSGWHHVVFVSSANNTPSVYVDKVSLVGTNRGGGHGGGAGWRIGGNTDGNEFFSNGLLDHVRIFNKALSSAEVTTLYDLENART